MTARATSVEPSHRRTSSYAGINLRALICLIAGVIAFGCRNSPELPPASTSTPPAAAPASAPAGTSAAPAKPSSGASATEEHAHTAPHGGALVELGEEFAHVELVLAASTGTFTAYVLDGEAERAVRLTQPVIDVVVTKENAAPVALELRAVANELTGERSGDTSQFAVTSPALAQTARFDGRIKAITIRGQEFRDVSFRFPEGSEH